MSYEIANLTAEQRQEIDQLEAKLGIVLIAYEGYRPEDEAGTPLKQ